MATQLQAIELAIITAVQDNGELPTDEIVTIVGDLFETEDDAGARKLLTTIERQVTKLDRDGKLTRRNAESGWQLTAMGRGALDGLRAKMESRYVAPYTNYAPVVATLEFITPTLGPVTEPGNQGIARFPRLETPMRYGDTIVRPGGPLLLGGWIRTALMKAAGVGDATVMIDAAGARRTLPDVAWSRVRVKPVPFPAGVPIDKSVRRPTNVRGQAVGEIVHESICGERFDLYMTFPLSHFSEMYLVRLFEQVEDVGISAAGMGKGGNWGLVICHSLKINGREVWPHALSYSPPIEADVHSNVREDARADVLPSALTNASANGHDPRDRVKAGSIRHA